MDEIRTSVGSVPYNAVVVMLAGGTSSAPGAGAAGSQTNPLAVIDSGSEYEFVAASATNQVLGSTGAIGDLLSGFEIVPATTSPGAVTFKDGAGTAMTAFAGGTVSDLKAWSFALGIKSTAGAWSVTTGANVSVIAVGDFT